MAKIIDRDVASDDISPRYSFWRYFLVGLIVGGAYSALGVIIASLLGLNEEISSDIASVVVVVLGVVLMLYLRLAQPMIIAIASSASLWGFYSSLYGLSSQERIAWVVGMYIVAYTLYSWIARYGKPAIVLTSALAAIVIVRVVMAM